MITLKTLPQASMQEVFDQIVAHLRKQGVRSYSEESDTCLYHSEDGLMCAAGCLIGEDEYMPSFEGKSWHMVAHESGLEIDHKVITMISELQEMHDVRSEGCWEDCFKGVAQDYDLVYEERNSGQAKHGQTQ